MVVHGGLSQNGDVLNDMFLFHFHQGRWDPVLKDSPFMPYLFNHSIHVWQDQATGRNCVYIYGGFKSNDFDCNPNVYVVELGDDPSIHPLAVVGTKPPARAEHCSVLVGKTLVVIGGRGKEELQRYRDVWSLDLGMLFKSLSTHTNVEAKQWTNHGDFDIPVSGLVACPLNRLEHGIVQLALIGNQPDEYGNFRQNVFVLTLRS
jgi:hypothetical protein